MSESENKKSSGIIELDFDFNEVQNVSEAFFKESEEILSDLDEHILRLENQAHDEVLLQSLFRKVHTLKGSVGAVPGGQLFGSLSHEFETLLDRLRKQKIQPNTECIEIFLHSSRLLKILAESLRTHREIYPEELSEAIELISRYGSFQLTAANEEAPRRALHSEVHDEDKKQNKDGIWLSKEQMSSLMELSSEFIILKNSLQTLTSSKETLSLQQMQEKQNGLSQSLNSLSDQFQSILDKAQKTPLKEAFSGLSPLIRQAAYELKKEVQVIEEGWDLEVDKALAQDLYKSLIHMVRNALDHGIETPDVRTQAGKSSQGILKIHVEEKSSVIHCEISDDGRGLDKDRILQRALEKGLTNSLEATQLSEEKIFAFIFHPGFSTKEKITTISGRGVGMDVVQNMVTNYGGSIDIQSTPGQGARIQLNIPVPKNLLIERCLLGEWQDFAFAFPLAQVSHISSCDELQVTEVDHMRFCQFENRTVPLLTVEEIYRFNTSLALDKVKTMSVVFLRFEDFTLGMLVDKIQHQADLVIKSFGSLIKKVPGFKGNSVLTEEQVAYVVDVQELQSLLQKEAS